MSRLRRLFTLSGWMWLSCLGCHPPAPTSHAPPVPPLLMLAPADASIVVWVPDLAMAVQGVADYASRLLAGTGWAITPDRQARWRESFGFSPLDPNAYRQGGIDVAAGALVVVQASQDKPLLGFKLTDPNRFDVFMRASQTVQGVLPQRTEQTLEGRRVVSWAPQADDTPPTHCAFYEDYVFAGSDLAKLVVYVRRLPQMPALARDSGAVAAQARVAAGQLMVWSHAADEVPQTAVRWSFSSTRLDSAGLASETFEPSAGSPSAESPNALSLSALLQRIDPLSFAVMAVGGGTAAQPWSGVDKLLTRDHARFGAVEEAFGDATGLSLTREVLPQMGDVMTAGIRWLNLAPPEGGWQGPNLAALLLQLEAGVTLQVKDGAAVHKLLERARTRLQEQGVRVQVTQQRVANESVTVYGTRVGGASALAVELPVRCAVWRDWLVLGVGSHGLTRVFDYLAAAPADWGTALSPQWVARHLQGRNSMAMIRFGVIGQALTDFVRDTPSAPALGLLVGDLATVLLRLGDLSTSARAVEGGTLGSIEQRFALDDSLRL